MHLNHDILQTKETLHINQNYVNDPKFTVKEFMLHPKSLGVHDFSQQQLIK